MSNNAQSYHTLNVFVLLFELIPVAEESILWWSPVKDILYVVQLKQFFVRGISLAKLLIEPFEHFPAAEECAVFIRWLQHLFYVRTTLANKFEYNQNTIGSDGLAVCTVTTFVPLRFHAMRMRQAFQNGENKITPLYQMSLRPIQKERIREME
jgi:hypothetical protein